LRRAGEDMSQLNLDITSTKERLEQLDSVKTDFITIASHELRTPLAQIRGYTDILDALNEQGMLDPDQMTGMTTNLRKATDRLERLIADMLDVSQLGLDAMDLRFTQTTIDSVLRLAIEPLSESIKQRKLQLAARGLKGLPPIQADMQRLVQAFRNVVLNAIKYTPDGGRIDITAHVQQNDKTRRDEIVVEIKDTGIGIDPKNHDLIFEKFFRVSDPGLHSTGATKFMGAGPGLGLTIARGVIEGHGGRIWVESSGYDQEKLPGSTFFIVLPVSPPEDAKRVMPFEGLVQPVPAAATNQRPN
jgi:signal transduction histidine kinase